MILSSGTALGQQCLHGEDEHALEQDRRQLALNIVRVISTAESGHAAQFGVSSGTRRMSPLRRSGVRSETCHTAPSNPLEALLDLSS